MILFSSFQCNKTLLKSLQHSYYSILLHNFVYLDFLIVRYKLKQNLLHQGFIILLIKSFYSTRVRKFLDDEEEEEMEIDRCNVFVRRLLYQELEKKFKSEAFVETKVLENKNR